jgi:Txe/YoeB family toxin of toxin-antitoxin system
VKIVLTTQYREDHRYWSEHDEAKAKKIDRLFAAISADPFKGIGKPEPLRYQLTSAGVDVSIRNIESSTLSKTRRSPS